MLSFEDISLFSRYNLRRSLAFQTTSKRSLEEIMDSMGNYAQSQGLTPAILESILNDE